MLVVVAYWCLSMFGVVCLLLSLCKCMFGVAACSLSVVCVFVDVGLLLRFVLVRRYGSLLFVVGCCSLYVVICVLCGCYCLFVVGCLSCVVCLFACCRGVLFLAIDVSCRFVVVVVCCCVLVVARCGWLFFAFVACSFLVD